MVGARRQQQLDKRRSSEISGKSDVHSRRQQANYGRKHHVRHIAKIVQPPIFLESAFGEQRNQSFVDKKMMTQTANTLSMNTLRFDENCFIRSLVCNGKICLSSRDICSILGYTNVSHELSKHCSQNYIVELQSIASHLGDNDSIQPRLNAISFISTMQS